MRALILGSLLAIVLGLAVMPRAEAETAFHEERAIALALADLPPEWGVTREIIEIIDCDKRQPQARQKLCDGGFAGWTEYQPVRIVLNQTILETWAPWWYETVIHEAVHVAHWRSCNSETADQGISQDLLEHFAHLFWLYTLGEWVGDPCTDQTESMGTIEEVEEQWWDGYPWIMRPMRPYSMTNFAEYVADTITGYLTGYKWWRYSNPMAHMAIEAYGLVNVNRP